MELRSGKAAFVQRYAAVSRRDDERLEQALRDRLAEEEVAVLGANRQVDAERHDQRACLAAGSDDHHVRVERTDVLVAHVEPSANAWTPDCGRSK